MLLVLHAGTRISLIAHYDLAASDYYLPTALSLLFVHRFGPGLVVPIMYINSVTTSHLWGTPSDQWWMWFVFAIPETLYTFLSWFLFKKVFHGNASLPDVRNLVLFLVVGIFVPAVIETFLLQTMLLMAELQASANYIKYVANNLLSEFAAAFFITIPCLYYSGFRLKDLSREHEPEGEDPVPITRRRAGIECAIIIVSLTALAFFLDFKTYWFIYGIFSLYVAIRFGFGPAIATNALIICLTYILPKLFDGLGRNTVQGLEDSINVFLGANLLYIFAAITGRVIDDLKRTECKLVTQNKRLEAANTELNQINEELDRFVYSVSHDLSAPLKSILGLVNISSQSKSDSEKDLYFRHIGNSVRKLESFIAEILDYSRNKRRALVTAPIDLRLLCDEVIESLIAFSMRKPQVEMNLMVTSFMQDPTRLSIIIKNLIANAIRFQRTYPDHEPLIRISSQRRDGKILIIVEDNGEGIPEELKSRVFEMFFRGSVTSNGSGLGLYIAREAVEKIKGRIWFESEYGKGSVFYVEFPGHPPD